MNRSTRRHTEQTQLAKKLKNFAAAESPQFKAGQLHEFYLDRTFILPFEQKQTTVRDEQTSVIHKAALDTDYVRIQMGFEAIRSPEDSYFAAHCEATRPVEPEAVTLTNELWAKAAQDWSIAQEYEGDELSAAVKLELGRVGIGCEQFLESRYTLSTLDSELDLVERQGYKIGGAYYTTVDRNDLLFHEPDDTDESEDEVAELSQERLLFDELTYELSEEIAQTGDIISFEDKRQELLFIIECLRTRTIPLH